MACPCTLLLSPPHFNILLPSEHNTKSGLIHTIISIALLLPRNLTYRSAQHKHCLNGPVWLKMGESNDFCNFTFTSVTSLFMFESNKYVKAALIWSDFIDQHLQSTMPMNLSQTHGCISFTTEQGKYYPNSIT